MKYQESGGASPPPPPPPPHPRLLWTSPSPVWECHYHTHNAGKNLVWKSNENQIAYFTSIDWYLWTLQWHVANMMCFEQLQKMKLELAMLGKRSFHSLPVSFQNSCCNSVAIFSSCHLAAFLPQSLQFRRRSLCQRIFQHWLFKGIENLRIWEDHCALILQTIFSATITRCK